MKLKKNPEHASFAYYMFLCLVGSAVVIISILNISTIYQALLWLVRTLSPIVIAFAIAYILNKPFEMFQRWYARLFKKSKKLPKIFSLITVYIILLGVIAVIFTMILPMLIDNLNTLVNNMPSYFEELQRFAVSILQQFHIDPSNITVMIMSWSDVMKEIAQWAYDYSDQIFNISLQVSMQVAMGIVAFTTGLIISVYALAWKKSILAQFDKLITGFVSPMKKLRCYEVLAEANRTFSGYLSGKILDCIIFFIVCFIILLCCNMPFPMLLSAICAVINFIPIFGPIIGTAIGALLVLITSPGQFIWFLIILIILQQIDANFLGPKILGNATGLSAFWIIVSITVGGQLFGLWGMMLAVPVFGVLISVIEMIIEVRSNKKKTIISDNNKS